MTESWTCITLTRGDVVTALAGTHPDDAASPTGFSEATIALAEKITDESMEYLARRVGDSVIDGGDYWDAIRTWYAEISKPTAGAREALRSSTDVRGRP